MIDRASEAVRVSWDEMFNKPVVEFLNIICYCRDKGEEEKRQIEEWKRLH